MPIGSAHQPCAVSPVEVTVASVVRTDVVGIATRRPHAYAWAAVGPSSHMRFNPRKRCNNALGRSSDLLLLKFGASGLPVWPSQTVALWMPECSRSSQQRACSGISPDSLFTALAFRLGQHQMHGKGNAFCASVAPKQSQNHFVLYCNVWIYIVLSILFARIFYGQIGQKDCYSVRVFTIF